MLTATFTCPRCFHASPALPGTKFCRHCGLADAQASAKEALPANLMIGDGSYHLIERIAIGSVSTAYRCQFEEKGRIIEAVCKIGRDARVNALLVNEATILKRLHAAGPSHQYTPALPGVQASMTVADGTRESPRQVNLLRCNDEIKSPIELYTLVEVKKQYPAGLDPHDVAWIWRRLLGILGFAHSNTIVHTAVLPDHVLIEPRDHKLVLIDWCCAVQSGPSQGVPFRVIAGGYGAWYRRVLGRSRPAATPMLDISFGARCMIDLLGGDPVSGEIPATVDPVLARHFRRAAEADGERLDAWKLLGDFDTLIEALWGPRKFHVLVMPPKRAQ